MATKKHAEQAREREAAEKAAERKEARQEKATEKKEAVEKATIEKEAVEKVAFNKAARISEYEAFKHEIVLSWQAGEHTKSLPLNVTHDLIAALDAAYDLGKKA
jgi:5-formyltetrahydrofolate cyclo-ligase